MDARLEQIPLDRIAESVGTPPSARLLASVQRMGIVQPVILTTAAREDAPLAIVDGNRRVAAARAANLSMVPAVVVTGIDADDIAAMTLVANGFRDANYLTEFWAIKHLERGGASVNEIRSLSGMVESAVQTRNYLRALPRDLFVALRNGQLLQSTALAIAKLPKADQELLLKRYQRRGKLSRSDIDALRPPKQPAAPVFDTTFMPPNSAPLLTAGNRGDDSQSTETSPAPVVTIESGTEPSIETLGHQINAAIATASTLGMDRMAFLTLVLRQWDATHAFPEL